MPPTAASRDVPIYVHLGQALGAIRTGFWVSGFHVVSCTVSGLETPRRFKLLPHQRAMVRGKGGNLHRLLETQGNLGLGMGAQIIIPAPSSLPLRRPHKVFPKVPGSLKVPRVCRRGWRGGPDGPVLTAPGPPT